MGSEKTKFKPKKRKAEGIANLITKLSKSTGIDAKILEDFIKDLDIPKEAKKALAVLTPMTYIGDAQKLANNLDFLI